MASLSGGLATMGPSVPYALSAKMAYPERVVVACSGDGAMQMIGINGLITISHRFKEWADPRLLVVVLNNGDLNMVTWEQRVSGGDRKFNDSQVLPSFPYAGYAQSLGLGGIRVTEPGAIGAAFDEAFKADRPVLLEMVTDPNVPPLPPHVSGKQAKDYAKALLHHDPQALDVVMATAREWWDGVTGGRDRR
jgi:pyruvate dehydrogenase (quinone)